MISDELINQLTPGLRRILDAEISLGNEVCETAKGWPNPNSTMIFLRKPFIGKYHEMGIEHREINDPHYWKSEYIDKRRDQILACKFE